MLSGKCNCKAPVNASDGTTAWWYGCTKCGATWVVLKSQTSDRKKAQEERKKKIEEKKKKEEEKKKKEDKKKK